MPMVINLNDRTRASFRHVNGQAEVTFHDLGNHSVLFPKGVQVTVSLVERLYETLKTERQTKRLEIVNEINNMEFNQ